MISKFFPKLSKIPIGLTFKCMKFFDMHEYQCKDLMRNYNIRVQNGKLALNSDDAFKIAQQLNPAGGLIVKSQVHAGGRGKGKLTSGLQGGVKVCKSPEEVQNYTSQMIGYNLITNQTPKEGLKVNAVLVHEGIDIKREIYIAFILDRNSQRPACVASKYGGMDIEEVAKTHPDSIIITPIEPAQGLTDEQALNIAKKLDLEDVADDARIQMKNLYKMFIDLDATQIEINPWATDPTNKLYCVDAKLNIDDSAKFRQQKLLEMKSKSLASENIDKYEEKAVAAGLSYIALDGNIGCLVNGAGLAMATMDIVKLYGGDPANFLDVGGGASVTQIKTAFEILQSHPSVKTILINIFGGILKCDKLADGIIQAAKLADLKVPLVVRLSGTNSELGNQKLIEFNKNKRMNITIATDLGDAAQKAVKIVKSQQ